MFSKILIANRGEIAVRIIRACKEMGIRTVAIYSEADRNSMHVRFADEAYFVGPPPTKESYLNIQRILTVAKQAGVEAIHPGYGFLAEKPTFAEECNASGFTLIGPSAYAQRAMAGKTSARKIMQAAGVPTVPGTTEPISDLQQAVKAASEIGYPVIIKAVEGGGGRGMRIVPNKAALEDAMRLAIGEAVSAFSDSAIYIEKYVELARHIEVQLLADNYGNVIHLGERECSIQRRYQKLIEESPSPALDSDLRCRITETAVRAAQAIGYNNAGTAEFLLEPQGDFYFLEMNTRLQVEHPVTEFVSGVDIVKAQIHLAAGEKLRFTQKDIVLKGAAIECRIYAEDPFNFFLPSIGVIRGIQEPSGPGVRVESAVHQGTLITVFYDPLIAKLITWGNTRNEAINRMRRALSEYQIIGVKTTIPFHRFVMEDKTFVRGLYNTGYVQNVWGQVVPEVEDLTPVAALAACMVAHSRRGTRRPSLRGREAQSPWKFFGRREMLRKM